MRASTYRPSLNSELRSVATLRKKLALAGIKINLIELRSCEFREKLTLAGIKINLMELRSDGRL